jgi:hypothetical protein
MAQPHFEKDYLAIRYDEPHRVIIATWKIPPTSQEFRSGMDILVNALSHFNTGKVIFDTRCLGIVLETDQVWTSRDWYRRAIKAGYSQVAFVMPIDSFTHMAVVETTERTPDRIPTAYVDTMTAAMIWIRTF